MSKILYDIMSQYPNGAQNGGVNEYEFIHDSQTPANWSYIRPSTIGGTEEFQDNHCSYDDAITVVTSPVPRVGSQCFRHRIAKNDPFDESYRAGRPRAELVRSSTQGVFPEQTWYTKVWYQVSFYVPSTLAFGSIGSWLAVMNLHNAISHPTFSGALPFDMWILSSQKWRLKTANSYDTSFTAVDLSDPIHTDEWEDFLLEIMWDPFQAGDGPGGSGGTGFLRAYRNGVQAFERLAPMGFIGDHNAGNPPPFFKFGLQVAPSSPPGLFPLEINTDAHIIGDSAETLQSMSPDSGQGQSQLAPLTFSLASGSYTVPQTITLSGINEVEGEGPTTGATAYYRINGGAFTEYSTGITLSTAGSFTVGAYQSKSGFDDSMISSETYSLSQPVISIPFRMECGRTSGILPAGWSYDSYASGFSVASYITTATIAGIPDGYTQSVFKSITFSAGINGALQYSNIPVPLGTFELRLALCEVHPTASYRYKVNPNGLGTAGWKHLGTEDIYEVLNPQAIVGRNTAFVVTRQITITTGLLTLVWSYHDDNGSLSVAGIELLSLPPPDDQIAQLILL